MTNTTKASATNNTLNSLVTPIQEEGRGIPMSPVANRVILKHDAKNGQVSILLPNEKDKDQLDVDSVTFVPLTAPRHLVKSSKETDSKIDSQLSYSNAFDVYQYGNDKSFGIMTRREGYDNLEVTGVYRVFGFLYMVNGKSIAKSGTKLAEMFGTNLVPCFMDMKYKKFKKLLDACTTAGIPSDVEAGRPIFEGNLITLTTDNSASLKYEDDSYWYPNFTVNSLPKAKQDGMNKFASDYMKVLHSYRDRILKNDKFLNTLVSFGLTKPNTINALRNMNIGDNDSLQKYMETLADNQIEQVKILKQRVNVKLGVMSTEAPNSNVKVEVASQQPQSQQISGNGFNSLTPEMAQMFKAFMAQQDPASNGQPATNVSSGQANNNQQLVGATSASEGFKDDGLPF